MNSAVRVLSGKKMYKSNIDGNHLYFFLWRPDEFSSEHMNYTNLILHQWFSINYWRFATVGQGGGCSFEKKYGRDKFTIKEVDRGLGCVRPGTVWKMTMNAMKEIIWCGWVEIWFPFSLKIVKQKKIDRKVECKWMEYFVIAGFIKC